MGLGFGLIGCGDVGRLHVACVKKIDGADFVAYADIDAQAAQSALRELGGRYATADVNELLCDKQIDAVYICTRNDSHPALAIAAARAGKHILVEKPLALTVEQCESVAAAVESAGMYLMPAFKMRYYPLIRKAREFIPHPQVMVAQTMDNPWREGAWQQDPVQGGGNVYSLGCHMTDLIRFLMGSEPAQVTAVGGSLTHPGHPCIDQCLASIKCANGHVAAWIQGDAGMGQFTGKHLVQLFGEGKSVQIYKGLTEAAFFDGHRTSFEQSDEGPGHGYQLENQAFVSALLEGRAPEISVRDGVEATRLAAAAEESLRMGKIVYLEPGPS